MIEELFHLTCNAAYGDKKCIYTAEARVVKITSMKKNCYICSILVPLGCSSITTIPIQGSVTFLLRLSMWSYKRYSNTQQNQP